ncbi:MAG: secretion system protein [Chloroflexi bacterium HGW-Chloroflexi-9]|nr:MAG: secretion system protein [Chloroflexi bacterium HGW-Chloroflexi-9]
MELIAAICFAAALFVGARAVLVHAPSATRARLDRIAQGDGTREVLPDVQQRVVQPLARGIGRAASALLPEHTGRWLEEEIAAGGMDFRPGTFVMVTAGSTLLMGGSIALMVLSSPRVPPGLGSLLALASVGLGLVGPVVWLRGRVARRQAEMQRALPDTLDLIVVSVEAGLGFDAAVARITDQSDGPLAEELRRVLADMSLGMSRRDALQAMALRARASGVSSLVTAILQAERTGMSIGGVLRSQATHVRTLRRQRAEEAAMKAPLKMLFPLMFFIFPSLFIVVLGPPVLNLMRTMGGN